ncbi:SDR family NAD(P)-dependent oxidoreductase [Papillibacter cinnamivorans]|uniref:2-deoxy-D-gluconate 3-dehydrogenase n=1 Tax=Papillibacter cinnamivorans DSM 12816 TaxID=1122930 RepID=A0A1W2BWD3_9FIRM|nr:3-oxoacyl-ACP reductase family protein [Papillibacter cinnamivorans]SMC77054.1 2-deoxy-D-gluconate 3-dehydrogenase [Papillibacter cinnamivorans DSM 12816]
MNLEKNGAELEGKVAIVTGSTRGIGRAIAEALAGAGASVVVTSRNQQDCDRTAAELETLGHSALGISIDASVPERVQTLVAKTTEHFGRLDILVNNAGIGGEEKPILDMTETEWDKTLSINLKGAYFTAQAAARQMKAQGTGGRIVNIVSLAGILAPKYASPYSAAKAGLMHLTKIMANEWARYGIRVNAVAPGYIETDMTRDLMADEKNAKAVMSKIALRRFGKASDVAGAVLFLVSGASDYVTGVTIPVDGGMHAV